MPKLKKKSSIQKQQEDRERKRSHIQLSSTPGSHSETEKEVSVDETASHQSVPSTSNVVQIIGTHEYSFYGVHPDEVLQGELRIQVMDYISQILKVQFNCSYGMMPPSYIYQLHTSRSGENLRKISQEGNAVQIHYIPSHYIVSAQISGQVYVYDSLLRRSHLDAVKGQLNIMYESLSSRDPVLLSPQSQGCTVLCGVFAVATAFTLLQKGDPAKIHLRVDQMRSHLKNCLLSGKFEQFPHTVVNPNKPVILDAMSQYFSDQTKRHDAKKKGISSAKQNSGPIDSFIGLSRKSRHTIIRRNKRQSKEYRDNERKNERKSKQGKRMIETFRDKERKSERKSKRDKRMIETFRDKERKSERKSKRDKRMIETFRDKERKIDRKSRQDKRTLEAYKIKENISQKESKRVKRKVASYRMQQNVKLKMAKQIQRQNQAYKDSEREITRNRRLVNKVYKDAEIERETYTRKTKRLDKSYKEAEQERETYTRRKKRQQVDYKENEKNRETHVRSIKRQQIDYKLIEKNREKLWRKCRRLNEFYRQKERILERCYRRRLRQTLSRNRLRQHRQNVYFMKLRRRNHVLKVKENNSECLSRRMRRLDLKVREKERVQNLKRKAKMKTKSNLLNVEDRINLFHRIVSEGPCHVCVSCKQLWYKHSLVSTRIFSSNISEKVTDTFRNCIGSVNKKEYMCRTCMSYLKRGKVPPCSEFNKMKFPDQGPLKEMNMLELALVAPLLPFMRIHKAPQGQQLKIQGNMVLVPSDIKNSVTALPRLPSETGTIKAKLKRRLRYKSHIYCLNIRPEKVRAGLKYLSQTSCLYKVHNVTYHEEVIEQFMNDEAECDGISSVSKTLSNEAESEKNDELINSGAADNERLEMNNSIIQENNRAPHYSKQCSESTPEEANKISELSMNAQFDVDQRDEKNSNVDFRSNRRIHTVERKARENTKQLMNEKLHVGYDTEAQRDTIDDNVRRIDQPAFPLPSQRQINDKVESLPEASENNVNRNTSVEPSKTVKCRSNGDIEDDSDQWSESDPQDTSPGILDTMLTAPDFVEASERDYVYAFAPAEGNIPVSVFLDKNSEELSFPGIFCGQARTSNKDRSVPVSYSEIVRSELRNSDRRAASCVENIFFKTKKLQMKQLIDQTQIVMRKYKTKGKTLTAKDVKGESAREFIHTDKAYKFMKSLRGSPPYFQAVSKDLFAMIRQLGPATFFMSLSAAETRWGHLLQILSNVVDKKNISEQEALNLTWQEKTRLIQSDPVTCARHFDFSVNKFMSDFIMSSAAPVGKVKDYFYRVEYQQRGSPHIHMMIWCEDAPKYGEDLTGEVIKYIDSFISCRKVDDNSELVELVKYQTHRHSHTCRKKNKKQCRFGFPKPPIQKTEILEPLDPNLSAEDVKAHKKNWTNIQSHLKSMTDNENVTFEEFLCKLGLTESAYILAVRSSIKSATVFLKRSPSERRINSYNPFCLRAWRANMDIQYVLDVYACASYIASYVTKAQRGMSELLRKACSEAKAGNQDLRQQVRTIGNKFLNAVEISAQEAVYICLGLPMRKSSRQVLFVNTSPPEERVALLKPSSVIENMKDDDEDIECSNLLTRYSLRPQKMENVTLAEYAAYYDSTKQFSASHSVSSARKTVDNLIPDKQISDNEDDCNYSESLNSLSKDGNRATQKIESGILKKRKIPRIIRYVHFNPDTVPEKYYREQIMLFYPWRDEDIDLIADCETYKARYEQLVEEIETERLIYEAYRDAVDSAEALVENIDTEFDEAWDNLAPNTEHMESVDIPEQTHTEAENDFYDIGADLGIRVTRQEDELNLVYEIPDHEFRAHMQSLTKEQIEFVYDTINELKTSSKPIYRFLSGGAGVGKSHVTKAVYQVAVKYYNKLAGEDFDQIKVLMLAPTGKAAYHIHGNTIHSGLRIAANQKLEHRPLNTNSLNTFRNQLGHISLIIIDEISMVGFRMFNCIYQRLQELKQSKQDFGGISIIAVGDLFQLRPVKDSYIFSPPNTNYMQLATNLWEENFSLYELTEIMRQKDNRSFAELLNRLREGVHTSDDIKLLSSRIIDRFDVDYPTKAVHLFTNNVKVNLHNELVLSSSCNRVYEVKARDRVVNPVSEEVKAKVLRSFEERKKTDTQLPSLLLLSEGFTYDVTINIDTQDGITNGTSCKVMRLEFLSTKSYPLGPVWVQYEHPEIGKHLRTHYKHRYKACHNVNWTPLMPVSRQFAAGHKGEIEVQRFQYPLRPAAAKTIHRSQGDTMNEAVVDLSLAENQRAPVDHIHYVALSRLKNITGLYIRDLNSNKISISKAVQGEMERLRKNKTEVSLSFLYNMTGVFKVAFLNARSLHRHLEDVKHDYNLQAVDIMCFSETRFTNLDSLQNTDVPGFHQYRQDSVVRDKTQRPAHGLSLYSREELLQAPKNLSSEMVEIMLSEVNSNFGQQIDLVSLYSPPKVVVKTLVKILSNIHQKYLTQSKAIIMGDFNIDWCSKSSETRYFCREVTNLGYRQLISKPTSDTGSTIDLVLTNFPEDADISAGTLPVYFSDHTIIWAAI